MAKTKREYIFATCFLSGAAAILSFVSLGTQYWITSDGEWTTIPGIEKNGIRYGLFAGSFVQTIGQHSTIELTMTCLFDKGVCAALCGTEELRYQQLKDLYNNKDPDYDTSCATISRGLPEIPFVFNKASGDGEDKTFINAGVWLSTIFFLVLSAVMGLLSSGLAVWNTAANPIQIYFSIFGMYIYNTIAFGTTLLVLLLWGIMFAKDTIHDVSIYHTLTGVMSTDELASLGYSYWLNLASLVLYALSICVLYARDYLISKEPKVNVHIEDNADPGIYLY